MCCASHIIDILKEASYQPGIVAGCNPGSPAKAPTLSLLFEKLPPGSVHHGPYHIYSTPPLKQRNCRQSAGVMQWIKLPSLPGLSYKYQDSHIEVKNKPTFDYGHLLWVLKRISSTYFGSLWALCHPASARSPKAMCRLWRPIPFLVRSALCVM